jgi:hypothetical protein
LFLYSSLTTGKNILLLLGGEQGEEMWMGKEGGMGLGKRRAMFIFVYTDVCYEISRK